MLTLALWKERRRVTCEPLVTLARGSEPPNTLVLHHLRPPVHLVATCLVFGFIIGPCLSQLQPAPTVAAALAVSSTAIVPVIEAATEDSEPLAVGPVPEPGALFLVGTALVGLALTVRRAHRRSR